PSVLFSSFFSCSVSPPDLHSFPTRRSSDLCSPWTLLANEHIRIDIVNNLLPKWLRDSIDVVGHVFFLLPLCIVMVLTGIPFFLKSFAINEQSWNAGGLPQWPSKALVMTAFAFLFVQGLSELVKRIAVMRDLIPDP